MSDLSSVDADLDRARVAFDSGIDGVLAAVQSALDAIQDQIDRLEGVHMELETKRVAVEKELDALADRAAQLEALTLPAPVAEGIVHDDPVGYVGAEDDVVVEYVDEHGNPVDEHGNPIADADDLVVYEEITLDDAPWADLELPRTDRLVALVEFHGELTAEEASDALAEVGDDVSTSTVSASLGNLVRQGRIAKLDAGTFCAA
jgi:hypothetical protein